MPTPKGKKKRVYERGGVDVGVGPSVASASAVSARGANRRAYRKKADSRSVAALGARF